MGGAWSVLQEGYSIRFSLFELFLTLLGMVAFAFLGSYWGVLAGNIKRDKEMEAINERGALLKAALVAEVSERKDGDRDLREAIGELDEGLTESVKEVNQRIDRWFENPRRWGNP